MSLDNIYLDALFSKLSRWGVVTEPGLNDTEIERIERQFGFAFPPDLRQFLQNRLPVSEGWVNWRAANEKEISEWLDWPASGICFDIQYNDFWLPQWGPRPHDLNKAFTLARAEVANAPLMIPIKGHRFIPAEPCSEGNPIFSIHQTDIIYYGYDLADYFATEYRVDPTALPDWVLPLPPRVATSPRAIRFWDILINLN